MPDTDEQQENIELAEKVMRLKYRAVTDQEAGAAERIKMLGAELYFAVNALGDKREYSLAKTKIEEAVLWAVKGITA